MTIESAPLVDTTVAHIDIAYRNGREYRVELKDIALRPDQPFLNDDIHVSTTTNNATTDNDDSKILSIQVKALKPLELLHFESKYKTTVDLKEMRMLANGFQSWSQARELGAEDRIAPIRSTVAYLTQYNLQGDYDFFQHSGETGHIHSSTYTHLRKKDDEDDTLYFYGSLTENLGYTYLKADFTSNGFSIYKDIVGKQVDSNQSIDLVRLFISKGRDAGTLWDAYASYFTDRRVQQQTQHVIGWTSWYNYYGDVSEDIVLRNLQALQEHKYRLQIFQIDDGFQNAVGDWLVINDKFPKGLKPIAAKIKEAGYTPGLWLAPYAVAFNSKLASEHPDWLIKDPATEKPVVAGPNWGGFYALDMYNEEARAHLKVVFDTVLRQWGFGMVKLDFLFAAAMIPRLGKSRGEIMWDAMQLVRDLTGDDRLLLGCGVPLACAWRNADYCRVGSDVAPWWEDSKLKYLHVRERVSTANSLTSTLNRWTMSDRMFGNDPDVIILRDNKNKLNPEERYTLSVLNNILGALVFSSDNVGDYGKDEHLLYRATFPKVVAKVKCVREIQPTVYRIQFEYEGRAYTVFANLSDDDVSVTLPSRSQDQLLFATDNEMHMTKRTSLIGFFRHKTTPLFYHPGSRISLKEHETKTFMHLPKQENVEQNQVTFLGSNSHIVPGAEITSLSPCNKDCKEGVELVFHKDNTRKHTVYVGCGQYLFTRGNTPSTPPACKINGATPKFETFKVAGGNGGPQQLVYAAVLTSSD